MTPRSRLSGALCALVIALLCIHLDGGAAQKGAQRWSSTGNNQQSAYGGYQANPQRQEPVEQQRLVAASPASQQRGRPQQQQQQQPQQQQESSYDSSASSSDAEADAEPASYGAVSGQPGRDFPNYTRVPKTSFSCSGLPYDYGMYADEETGCQAYHLCYNGRKESFLCGVGTVFNQRILHCDYWYSVDCGKSSSYYSSNAYMGSSQPEPGPAEANAAPSVQQQQQQQQQSYGKTSNRPAAPSSNFRQQAAANSFSRNTQQQVQDSY